MPRRSASFNRAASSLLAPEDEQYQALQSDRQSQCCQFECFDALSGNPLIESCIRFGSRAVRVDDASAHEGPRH